MAKVECTCQQCGVRFITSPSKAGKYCSRKCYGLSKINRINLTCLHCGNAFVAHHCDIKNGGGKYCSRHCHDLARLSRVVRFCLNCERPFEVLPSSLKRGEGFYCSHECSGEAHSKEKCHFWQGGKFFYGSNWKTQRRKALERDGGICQICHRKPKVNEKSFDVHHVVKRRNFTKDDIAANELSNLITLCPQCHSKAEHGKIAVPVRLL